MKMAENETATTPMVRSAACRRDIRLLSRGAGPADHTVSFPLSCPQMARATVFGAGAMGTALAMHLARAGNETVLWASEFDRRIFPDLVEQRRHPALPQHLPESLSVLGADALEAAADGTEI